ncbi:aspartate aminotransferase family protein [Micromonospora sp. NPDC005161]
MSDLSLAERADAVLPPAAGRATRLGIVRAQGSQVWDERGRRYLDLTCGVGVTNLGHNHPAVLAAMRAQLDQAVHVGHNVVYYPTYVQLAERLVATLPGDHKAFLSNSGAEAVEAAVKLCLSVTGRSTLIAFRRGFHGRTTTAMGLSTSSAAYRRGYGSLLPPVHHLPFPTSFRTGRAEADEVAACLDAFDEHLALVTPGEDIAAVIVEPVQGEGGYLPAPTAFLLGLAERCQRHGIPLVFDEIQTGFGRTGRRFAWEHSGVAPDVLVLAKGIANGMPLSAIVARTELMDAWPAGAHGGTYNGNPVACAAALAVLDQLDEDLLQRARALGDRLRAGLTTIVENHPSPVDVRGLGLMIGVEFLDEHRQPDSALVAGIKCHAEEARVILLPCGSDRNVIRLIPALTMTDAEADQALAVLAEAYGKAMAACGKNKA